MIRTKGLYLRLATSLITLLLLAKNCLSETIVINQNTHAENVSDKAFFFIDLKNKVDVKNVESFLPKFLENKSSALNFGISPLTYWIFLDIKDSTPNDLFAVELRNPLINKITCYVFNKNAIVDSSTVGQNFPFSQRTFSNENFIFRTKAAVPTNYKFFFKINSSNQLLVPIFIGSNEEIHQSISIRNLIFGIYLGIIFVMILYNLFIYISVKDKNYIYYIIYIIFVGLSQANLNGFTFHYLFPNNPWIAIQSNNIIPSLSGIAVVIFFKSFLLTKNHIPIHSKILTLYYVIYPTAIILSIAGELRLSLQILQVTALTGVMYLFYLSVIIVRKKYRPAKFFLLAWSVFFASICIFILRNFNVLPYNWFTDYILLIGSSCEVTLLSFALADRINILKREKEASQAVALEEAQRNEILIRDQNVVLERKVDERTAQLTETMTDLKNTQVQLVDAEKMASLGQLTAGIAHEINNPINFVTSNIKPLQRDIEDIYTLLEKLEEQTIHLSPEQVAEIERLKKDLDIDYVKSEINILLRGIDEGANRTAEIIKGLRKFSRVDEQDLKEVDLKEGVESTLLLLNTKIRDQLTVKCNWADIPKVECFAGKINQVFMNILTNSIYAVKTKFPSSAEGCIVIDAAKYGDNEVTIVISDNGPGIPNEIISKIFDPFFTTKPIGEGSGLGLSIVNNIIRAHKGTINVSTGVSGGTEFKITLPIRQ